MINNIDVTDENGQKSDAAHENFVDALIEAARSQTFTKLSFYKEKVTEDLYLDSLRENMEIGLVTMFAIDRVPTDKPLNDETKDFIESEYQRLLDSI